jgi:hypothetical protein
MRSGFIFYLVIFFFSACLLQAQLTFESFVVPSQALMNQNLNAEVLVRNDSSASRTGNLKFYLINESYPELGIFEFASFPQLQFFAPNQSRFFQLQLPVSEDYFRIGGNTVVIWPSMVGQSGDSLVITRDIYVDEVSVTGNIEKQLNTIRIYPNPASKLLLIKEGFPFVVQYEIFGLDGKLLLQGFIDDHQIDISNLKNGVYMLCVKNEDKGLLKFQRFLKE